MSSKIYVIKRKYITTYTPQKNGVFEINNLTIIEMAGACSKK